MPVLSTLSYRQARYWSVIAGGLTREAGKLHKLPCESGEKKSSSIYSFDTMPPDFIISKKSSLPTASAMTVSKFVNRKETPTTHALSPSR